MSDLEQLHRKRGNIQRSITILNKTLNSWIEKPALRDIDYLQAALDSLKRTFLKFDDIQDELEALDTEEISKREIIEESYNKVVGLANKLLREFSSQNVSTKNVQSAPSTSNRSAYPSQLLLPQVNLPTFDGSPEKWNSFFDLFSSMIDSIEDLTPVRKLHYLRLSLTGKAATAIESLETTDTNYQVALDILKKKFECTRKILRRHFAILREYPRLTKDSPTAINNLVDTFNQHIRCLKSLEAPVNHWDIPLIDLILSKISSTTAWHWEMTLDGNEMPSYTNLLDFLQKRASCAEFSTANESSTNTNITFRSSFKPEHNKNKRIKHHSPQAQTFVTQISRQCPICSENHTIYQCEKFRALSPEQKRKSVTDHMLCFNCLSRGHGYQNCSSVKTCNKCHKRHHTLLHKVPATPTQDSSNKEKNNVTNLTNNRTPTICSARNDLLVTAVVNIKTAQDQLIKGRALIDTCSSSNLITENLVRILNLKTTASFSNINSLGNITTISRGTVTAFISSVDNKYNKSLTFLVVPNISQKIPSEQISRRHIKIPPNIILADPEFYIPAPVDLLLSSGVALSILCIGQINLSQEKGPELFLQKTKLGWVIGGSVSNHHSHTRICHMTNELHFDLCKFWEIEEVPFNSHFTAEEKECEDHFMKHVTRDETGRYTVALPFNNKIRDLGESYKMAQRRFFGIEKKLEADKNLKIQYHQTMKEYLDLNHMSPTSENNSPCYYLPHHAVIKESSLTTRLRVVFDGSVKTSTGISLNDTLMVGPTIQTDLFSLLIRFRIHLYVITGDIEKMYRQILIRPEDRCYQRIIWRNQENMEQKFELNTVTFGLASAPYLAIRTLHQLADDESDSYPLASRVLKNDLYVDDVITGAATKEDAIILRNQLINILNQGGFKIRQWASNDRKILQDLPEESINLQLQIGESSTIKTLGVHWDSHLDRIVYSVNPLSNSARVTKRQILSETAKIFDPLGLLSPVIIKAKILMQKLWSLKVDWDESLPLDIHSEWNHYHRQLSLLNNLYFQRRTTISNIRLAQIHGFCDASERAYGACLYLRTIDDKGQIEINLLCAKSRVAPLKTITIPRLELCGALLLTSLFNSVIKILPLKLNGTFFWTDSMIVLHWLNTEPSKLKTFVANRISEIQSKTNVKNWYHVKTDHNPADLASRGQWPEEFIRDSGNIWKHGPSWLFGNEWPIANIQHVENPPELRQINCFLTQIDSSTTKEINNLLNRFSSFCKLQRVLAYCLRMKKSNQSKGPINITELKTTHDLIINLTQKLTFPTELENIRRTGTLKNSSKLLRLTPFIDEHDILRVGGRLKNASVPFNERHPIILPKNHHITNLIIEREHKLHMHAGTQATLYSIRRKYWPLDGRRQVWKIIRSCIICFKTKPKPTGYLMGNLPTARVNESRPFTHVGVDYCGPFTIKEKKFRNRNKIKVYVAVFICLAIKAIHLEVVSDLTSEGFLAALRRFIARRGHCAHIYSDNGTCFVGANRELKEILKSMQSDSFQQQVQEYLTPKFIQWHFIPPQSPHFGGLWEAAVKAFKFHLKKVAGIELLFTFEEFNTLIIEIESILNSRPLTPLSNDPNDLSVLTPGHFLIGESLTNLVDRDHRNTPISHLSRWQHLQKIKRDFWIRWKREYLNELMCRSKWQKNSANIKVNDIVLIKDDQLPPLHWPTGRIIELHPGDDNIVRTVTLKTARGTYKRNVTRLCPLPIPSGLNTVVE